MRQARSVLSKKRRGKITPCVTDGLLGIRIPEVHDLRAFPQRESTSMRRRRIFSLLDCGQCSGIVQDSYMTIDSPANDWFLTSTAKQ